VARWAVGTRVAALLKAVWWDLRVASLLTHLFLFLFFHRTAKHNTPINRVAYLFFNGKSTLLKTFELFRVCHGQISTPAPCVHRNATGFQVRVGARVSVRFGCRYQNRRRERVRVPEPYT